MPRRIAFKLPRDEKLKTALVTTAGSLLKTDKSPDEALGDLFTDVQKSKVYNDNKTFIDLVPRGRMKAIQKEYLLAKDDPNFDLREFVNRHFYEFAPHKNEEFHADPTQSVSQHIHILWKHLTRRNLFCGSI